MASRPPVAALRQIHRLFGRGTVSGLAEGQLLERFVAHRDEAAFEALVARFGPMVLGVCRRVLTDPHDVEDAFQATFLILVRRAGTIRDPGRLGPWLHGVASRVAVRARADAARRRDRDRLVAREEAVMGPTARAESDEARPILDEEIRRLPEPFRSAIVLCHLEGLTHEQAADRLRCPVGTVRSRLSRGRERLRIGLSRRGVALSVAALGALLVPESARAAVPPLLAASTTSAAIRSASATALGALSAGALSLTQAELRAMTLTKIKAVALVTTALVAATGVVALSGQAAGPRADDRRAAVPDDLARLIKGKVAGAIPIDKDAMILAYLPQWDHGEVDNLAVAGNDGGVRAMLHWPDPSADDLAPPGRRFLLALYSRKTTAHPPVGPILAFEILDDWPERTSWETMPRHADEAAASFPFIAGDGWKLLDVTALVRSLAQEKRPGRGVMLRFLNEDRSGRKQDWSGYAFVSREGEGEWADRRPLLLLADVDGAMGGQPKPAAGQAPPDRVDRATDEALQEGGARRLADPRSRERLRERVRLVQRLLEEAKRRPEVGLPDLPPDRLYFWSRRLMEDQTRLGDKPSDHIDAIRVHLDRMKALEVRYEALGRAGQVTQDALDEAKYYRLEAEELLDEAKAGGGTGEAKPGR